MALLERAKQVAAEFEYSPDDVRKGVAEFLREMGEQNDVNAKRHAC